MHPVKSLLYFFVLICLFASCKSKQRANAPKSNIGGETLSEKDRIDFEFLFFDATKEKLLGNFSQAQVKFQQAIRINPKASAAHFELSQVYLNTGNSDLAELSGKNAVRFDDSNKWYKLSLADIYAQNRKFDEVAQLMNQLHKKYPNNQEYLLGLGTALVNDKKYSEAAKVYEELEILSGINEEVALQKKNLFMQLGKPEKAILEIQKLMNAFPDEIGYRGFLAEIYEDTNQPEKALDEYNEIIKRDPENPSVHFSLAEYYRRQGDKENSYQELKKSIC